MMLPLTTTGTEGIVDTLGLYCSLRSSPSDLRSLLADLVEWYLFLDLITFLSKK